MIGASVHVVGYMSPGQSEADSSQGQQQLYLTGGISFIYPGGRFVIDSRRDTFELEGPPVLAAGELWLASNSTSKNMTTSGSAGQCPQQQLRLPAPEFFGVFASPEAKLSESWPRLAAGDTEGSATSSSTTSSMMDQTTEKIVDNRTPSPAPLGEKMARLRAARERQQQNLRKRTPSSQPPTVSPPSAKPQQPKRSSGRRRLPSDGTAGAAIPSVTASTTTQLAKRGRGRPSRSSAGATGGAASPPLKRVRVDRRPRISASPALSSPSPSTSAPAPASADCRRSGRLSRSLTTPLRPLPPVLSNQAVASLARRYGFYVGRHRRRQSRQ